jgi:hypothetical protein
MPTTSDKCILPLINLMRNLNWLYKLQLSLITAIYIAFGSGCVSLPTQQSVSMTSNLNPTMIPTVELRATQEKILSPFPTVTFPPADPIDLIWEMIGEVNIGRALTDIKKLTGEEPFCIDNECYTIHNRVTGSEELSWAKNYVYQELVRLGYATELQGWSRSGYTDQNIIARKPGALHPEEEIYFVAHLDGVIGSPAADDNASGVVDILELARVLSSYAFSRTIVLLISTGEEQGTLGVQSYLDQLSPSELSSIQYVVNIDMIGYDANQDRVMELWYGDHSPSLDLITRMAEIIRDYQLDLVPRFVVGCG